jgi:hypothetical protein
MTGRGIACADVHSAETMVSVCRVGLKVIDGGGFAASLNGFSKAWTIYFPMWSAAKRHSLKRETIHGKRRE